MIAIIAIVLAITLPVLSIARKSGQRTVVISNLHQCALALQVYAADSGDFPVGAAADQVFEGMPTCDPADTWRASCNEPAERPMAGSFGYVRYVEKFAEPKGWAEFQNQNDNPILLVSIFHGTYPIDEFRGPTPNMPECFAFKTCIFPDKRIVGRVDGSASVVRRNTFTPRGERSGSGVIFTWESAFDNMPLYEPR